VSIWQQETAAVIDRYDADVRDAGLAEVWDHLLAQDDSGSRSLLLGVVGALASYLVETDYRRST
jgi:hypothetical protein